MSTSFVMIQYTGHTQWSDNGCFSVFFILIVCLILTLENVGGLWERKKVSKYFWIIEILQPLLLFLRLLNCKVDVCSDVFLTNKQLSLTIPKFSLWLKLAMLQDLFVMIWFIFQGKTHKLCTPSSSLFKLKNTLNNLYPLSITKKYYKSRIFITLKV